MINNLTQNPETQRRQALARVYALLIRLADEKESLNVQVLDDKTNAPEEETQGKSKGGRQRRRTSPAGIAPNIPP